MSGPVFLLVVIIGIPVVAMFWNKMRTRGKILGVFVRKDKSVEMVLCKLYNDFVFYKDRAYEIWPDFVRVSRFPSGWPGPLQELVPIALYDEEDAIPLDWINIDQRQIRAMELKAALDENWLAKLVHETIAEGGVGFKFNFRKWLPILIIVVGVVGLVAMLILR